MATFVLTAGNDAFTGGSEDDVFAALALADNRGQDNFQANRGRDRLVVDYSSSTGDQSFVNTIASDMGNEAFFGNLTARYLDTAENAATSYAGFEELVILLGSGRNAVDVDPRILTRGGSITLDGGGGIDTLTLDSRYMGNTSFSVTLNGAISSNVGTYSAFEIFNISIGAGTHSVQTQGSNDSVSAYDGGTSTIGTGGGDDSIVVIDANTTLDGGEGKDSLILGKVSNKADLGVTVNGTSATTSDGTSAQGIEAYTITTGSGADTFTVSGIETGTMNGGGGSDKLVIDVSALTGVQSNSSFVGPDGQGGLRGRVNDRLNFSGFETVDIALDAQNNLFDVDATPTRAGATLKIDGGAGTDQILLAGKRAGWSITATDTGGFVFNDIDTSDGDIGTFTATAFETVRFADLTLELATLGKGQTLIGDDGPNTLTGTAFDDLIEGRGGDDTLTGGGGIDTLSYKTAPTAVRVRLDQIGTPQATGGAGSDTLVDKFEALIGSALSDVLIGNDLANRITGLGGNDRINGQAGADQMIGGLGNDSYVVDNAADIVIEKVGEGTDSVSSSVSHRLRAQVENLTLTGTAAINGTGNELANRMTGNAADNALSGLDGADTLSGGAGRDRLSGGAGNDRLSGGTGIDTLTGGDGADRFVFDRLETSAQRDVNADFAHGIDTIAFARAAFAAFAGDPAGALAANAFVVGAAATTADHHVIYNQTTGTLFYDADGVGGAAQIRIAILTGKPVLDAADILLV